MNLPKPMTTVKSIIFGTCTLFAATAVMDTYAFERGTNSTKRAAAVKVVDGMYIINNKEGDCTNRRHSKSGTTDCNSGRLRTELRLHKDSLKSFNNQYKNLTRTISYSIMFPEDYPLDGTSSNPYFTQILAYNGKDSGQCGPIGNFNEVNGNLLFNGEILTKIEHNKWYDVEMEIKFSVKDDGYLRASLNGEEKYYREFITIDRNRAKVSYKFGIYRTPSWGSMVSRDRSIAREELTVHFKDIKISKK